MKPQTISISMSQTHLFCFSYHIIFGFQPFKWLSFKWSKKMLKKIKSFKMGLIENWKVVFWVWPFCKTHWLVQLFLVNLLKLTKKKRVLWKWWRTLLWEQIPHISPRCIYFLHLNSGPKGFWCKSLFDKGKSVWDRGLFWLWCFIQFIIIICFFNSTIHGS